MNGAHDLGGKHGFGEIDRSQDANFAAEWEEKVFALTLASGMLGRWNLDQSRSAREQMDPGHYLQSSYYEHWLFGLEQLLVEKNLVTAEELKTGVAQTDASLSAPDPEAADPEKMQQILDVGGPTLLEVKREPEFRIGDQVVVQADQPLSHTRAPGYVKGKIGIVVSHHGAHIFADEHASSGDKTGEHLYGVKFEADALWGKQASAGSTHAGSVHLDKLPSDNNFTVSKDVVYVDLFEPYLLSMANYRKLLGA